MATKGATASMQALAMAKIKEQGKRVGVALDVPFPPLTLFRDKSYQDAQALQDIADWLEKIDIEDTALDPVLTLAPEFLEFLTKDGLVYYLEQLGVSPAEKVTKDELLEMALNLEVETSE